MDFILITVGLGSLGLGVLLGHYLWNKPPTSRTLNAKTIEQRIAELDAKEESDG